MNTLPYELHQMVFEQLDGQSCIAMSITCSHWHHLMGQLLAPLLSYGIPGFPFGSSGFQVQHTAFGLVPRRGAQPILTGAPASEWYTPSFALTDKPVIFVERIMYQWHTFPLPATGRIVKGLLVSPRCSPVTITFDVENSESGEIVNVSQGTVPPWHRFLLYPLDYDTQLNPREKFIPVIRNNNHQAWFCPVYYDLLK